MTAPVRPAQDMAALADAALILRSGGLVAMPTETVYGLAADAGNARAVARLYAAKGRPRFNPLIAHVADIETAERCGVFCDLSRRLAAAFWPGPLTLVLPRRTDAPVSDLATAGLDTVALRIPDHPAARALLAAFGGPLAAPSANPSGAVSPTTAQHVAEGLGDKIDLILDAGPCRVGVESTVVAIMDGKAVLLRPGGLPRAEIEAITGPLAAAGETAAPAAPGMLKSHYAPRAPLRLNALEPGAGEAYLGFGPGALEGALNLSPGADLAEAAANLFAYLRHLDAGAPRAIAVAPVPEAGLGEAINDRLRRAAAREDA
ncbi:MAG: threonylcarbamoyl-AMP synthase [Maricaulaceae bacterium]|nr:threonylcarbamoyl-AMP synthase [Maricaulaceae bacterium]